MAEKVVKRVSHEEVRKAHDEVIAERFNAFLSEENNLWPELKIWDYKTLYGMDPIEWNSKYGEEYLKNRNTYAAEKLFQWAAMQGATRDELVRIMAYILAIIDSGKYFLDVKHAKIDLGINELFHKFMVSRPKNKARSFVEHLG